MAIEGTITVVGSVASTLDVPENREGTMFDAIRDLYIFTDGTGVSENDLVWSGRFDITAGGALELQIDLSPLQVNNSGAGWVAEDDVFGNAITFVDVTCIIIRNRETTAGQQIVQFGPGAANPFLWTFVDASDLIEIPPGSVYCQYTDADTLPIVTGVNDALRIINTDAANNAEIDILVVGRSA